MCSAAHATALSVCQSYQLHIFRKYCTKASAMHAKRHASKEWPIHLLSMTSPTTCLPFCLQLAVWVDQNFEGFARLMTLAHAAHESDTETTSSLSFRFIVPDVLRHHFALPDVRLNRTAVCTSAIVSYFFRLNTYVLAGSDIMANLDDTWNCTDGAYRPPTDGIH
jgi:hypothetical protein